MATLRIALAALLALLSAASRRGRSGTAARRTTLQELPGRTTIDTRTGAVRSTQAVAVLVAREALVGITGAAGMEWLGRTYWSFLRRVTLGLVRTRAPERSPTLMVGPLRLMSFGAPEYDARPGRARVRWRIEHGLLVALAGRDGQGHLQLGLRRGPDAGGERSWLELEVEVAGFHPALARLSRRLYEQTQARVHVRVTRSFLRSLAHRYPAGAATAAESGASSPGGVSGAARPRRSLKRGAARRPAGAASRDRGPR